MRGFTDLHCHWIPGIDDGAPSARAGVEMLERLYAAGFSTVVATPHMRPGMFDNASEDLRFAFEAMQPIIAKQRSVPEVQLSSEHYFDELVVGRLLRGEGLPYPGGKAVLIEFYPVEFPVTLRQQLFQLQQHGYLPVIAHPERYQPLWRNPELLETLVDAGAAALLDTASLVGKYGQRTRACAEELLEMGLYHAACSDAHRPDDVDDVVAAMKRIERTYGAEELEFLFAEGPAELLQGRLPE